MNRVDQGIQTYLNKSLSEKDAGEEYFILCSPLA